MKKRVFSITLICLILSIALILAICDTSVDDYEYDDESDNATWIEVDETQHHTFHNGSDQDWVKFNITEGQNYTIYTHDLCEDENVSTDTYLSLYNSSLDEIDSNDDWNCLDSRICFTANETGTYYANVTPYDFPDGENGSYKLTLADENLCDLQIYDDTNTEISACGLIVENGTYHLTDSIYSYVEGGCLNIIADDVILDCNDYSLLGSGECCEANEFGIYVDAVSNVTVRNCNVRDFYGIQIYVENSENITIEDSSTAYGEVGIYLYDTGYSGVLRNTVSDAGMFGILLENTDMGGEFSHNNVEDNIVYNTEINSTGIYIADDNNTIIGNEIECSIFNSSVGFGVGYGDFPWVEGPPMFLSSISENNVFEDNEAYGCAAGFYADYVLDVNESTGYYHDNLIGMYFFFNEAHTPYVFDTEVSENCYGAMLMSTNVIMSDMVFENNGESCSNNECEESIEDSGIPFEQAGLYLFSSHLDLTNSDFINNGQWGLYDDESEDSVNWTIDDIIICRDNDINISEGSIDDIDNIDGDNCTVWLSGEIVADFEPVEEEQRRGGGGVSGTSTFISWDDLASQGITKTLSKGDIVTFKTDDGEWHQVKVLDITSEGVRVQVASTPQSAVLNAGESETFDLDDDEIDDLKVTVNSIDGDKVDVTIKTIEGAAAAGEGEAGAGEAGEGEAGEGEEGEEETNSTTLIWILVIAVIVILVIIGIVMRKKK